MTWYGQDELITANLRPRRRVVTVLLQPLEYVCLTVDIGRRLHGVGDGDLEVTQGGARGNGDVDWSAEGVAYLHRGIIYIPPPDYLRVAVELTLGPQAVTMCTH